MDFPELLPIPNESPGSKLEFAKVLNAKKVIKTLRGKTQIGFPIGFPILNF